MIKKIIKSQSATSLGSIGSSIPLECFENTSPNSLSSILNAMDLRKTRFCFINELNYF